MSSRRQFLGGMAAIGTGAIFASHLNAQQRGQGGQAGRGGGRGGRGGRAERPIPPNLKAGRRIDVHHHYAPPGWIKVLSDNGAFKTSSWEGWSPARAVEDMDKGGVEISYSSITTPGIYFDEGFGNQAAAPGKTFKTNVIALAREANEFGAKMKSDFPGRFGIWASLPLPDVDASLKEIEYAFDKLKLDGIGLVTSIGRKYLGDASFSPVFAELNKRNAIVYTHPEAGPCCNYAIPGVGPTTLEYSHDTARTIVSWIDSGSADRFPNVRWIFSHGGGSIWSARYIGGELGTSDKGFESRTAAQMPKLTHLRRFYYDTAASSNWEQMELLKRLVGSTNIVFGCDNPYGVPLTYAQDLQELQDSGTLTAQDVKNINRDNMVRWIPKLA